MNVERRPPSCLVQIDFLIVGATVKGNQTGLDILDSYEERWAVSESLTDEQLAEGLERARLALPEHHR